MIHLQISRNLLLKNPLRLLDSKDVKLKDILHSVPKINSHINKESLT